MEEFLTRKFSLGSKEPLSLNEENRCVDIIIATDTNEIMRYDHESAQGIPEILIMSGCQVPDSGQVPLLDSHSRWSVSDIYGSVSNINIEGNRLVGTARYAKGGKAENAWILTRDGHLTDYSAGFKVHEILKLENGEKKELDNRTYEGPAILITSWQLKEVSACPIGADSNAKARSQEINKEESMGEKPREKEMEQRSDNQVETPVPEASSEEKIRTEAANQERKRVTEITQMCRSFDCENLADELIDNSKTIDQARASILDALKARSEKSGTNKVNARFDKVIDEMDKFRTAAEDALCIRAGFPVENRSPGSEELAGFTLREIAREYISRSGKRPGGNVVEMVGRALTTTDFPVLLGNIINTSLSAGWQESNETWEQWCSTGSLNDFKTHNFAQSGAFDDLDEIPEDGEYRYGSFGEAKETVKMVKYGKLTAITREAIINDDMGVITDIPRKMGLAAARKVGDLPYAVLIANAKMGDNSPLFHSNHKNLAGTGAALGIDPLNSAFAAMAKQKDVSGKQRLNIRPAVFLAPVSMMGTSEEFFKTDKIDNLDNNTRKTNIYSGNVLNRVYESRLDDDSETAWYLAAGQKDMTVTVFFLQGNNKPYMESKTGWTRDGMEYKVRMEAAAAARDFRGLYKNGGV